jgi:hypothetical protein
MEKKPDFASILWDAIGKLDDAPRLDSRGNTWEEGYTVTEGDIRQALKTLAEAQDIDALLGTFTRAAIGFYNAPTDDANAAKVWDDARLEMTNALRISSAWRKL